MRRRDSSYGGTPVRALRDKHVAPSIPEAFAVMSPFFRSKRVARIGGTYACSVYRREPTADSNLDDMDVSSSCPQGNVGEGHRSLFCNHNVEFARRARESLVCLLL